MANQLGMANQQAIVALAARGWSFRRIARELGVHRETVARYVDLARQAAQKPKADKQDLSKPAISTAGSDTNDGSIFLTRDGPNQPQTSLASAELAELVSPPGLPILPDTSAGAGSLCSKPAISTAGSVGRGSLCEPFREAITEALERGLSAQRIWQDLRSEHGFEGSYESVKRFTHALRTRTPLPFRRMECEPGAEAQVDFGTGAPIRMPDGKRRRTHVFRIVLSHSRKGYSEVVYRQTTESFLRCLENAFWHFGGVPKTLVIDNLKAAVTKADWYDPELNPKMFSFAEHYGTVILPTRPRTPRHKGKVERGVDYVQSNALKGHTFESLEQENRHLLDWEATVADTRIHGTTRRQVGKIFREVERDCLLQLPIQRFPMFHEGRRCVHRDAHVEVDKSYYSVPPEYTRRQVWVRWDERLVRIFNQQMVQIAVHPKRPQGCFSTQHKHIASEKIWSVERGAVSLLAQANRIGPNTGGWATSMLQERGIQGVRVLVGLLALAKRHPADLIEKACRIAGEHCIYRLKVIRKLIKRQMPDQAEFDFIQEAPIIRSMSEYENVVRASIQGETRPRLDYQEQICE